MAFMKAQARKARQVGSVLLLGSALFAGGALLLAGPGDEVPTSDAEFVSFQPFEAVMCPLPGRAALPYSRSPFMVGQQDENVAPPSPAADPATQVDRAPLHFIKDPYPAWSAIAVNPENDMVVLTDENLHRIVEYGRLDNTPADLEMTAPRRIIGGDQTATEMMCGVYIDPETLDVFVTNNDTVNWLPVFGREARGNVTPDRKLATPHRTWAIAADEIRQELYMTIQSPSAVVVYPKSAEGASEPLRFLEGDATRLADPRGLAVDTVNNLFVVGNHGHRTFYGGEAISSMRGTWTEWIEGNGFPVQTGLRMLPRRPRAELGARFELPSLNIYTLGVGGNTAPIRVIQGLRTQLNWPGHVAVHEERGEIFVANDAADEILVFRLSDSGNVAPIRVLKGPGTGIFAPTGLALDRVNDELWVANMGNYAATVYPITANGDVEPLRTIRGGPAGQTGLMIGNPGAVGYDTRRDEILVPN